MNKEQFSSVYSNVVDFLKSAYVNPVTEIPVVALIMGGMLVEDVHLSLLMDKLEKEVTPHFVYVYEEDCRHVKIVMDRIIERFLLHSDDTDDEVSLARIQFKCV